jgi:hypothetical protein
MKTSQFVAATLFAYIMTIMGCGNMCSNEQVQSVTSPSNQWTAIAFIRDCGATTGKSSQVSIVRRGDVLSNESGNALVLEAPVPISLHWTPSEHLVIQGTRGVKRFKEESVVGGVRILYP